MPSLLSFGRLYAGFWVSVGWLVGKEIHPLLRARLYCIHAKKSGRVSVLLPQRQSKARSRTQHKSASDFYCFKLENVVNGTVLNMLMSSARSPPLDEEKKSYRHRDWITNSLCEKAVSIWEHEKSSYHFPLDLIRIGSHLHCALSLPSIRLAIHFHPRLQRLSAFLKLTHNCLFSSRKDDVLWFHWDKASEGRAVRQWMRWWWRWWVSRSELKALKWFVYVYLFSTMNVYSFSHIICYESLFSGEQIDSHTMSFSPVLWPPKK